MKLAQLVHGLHGQEGAVQITGLTADSRAVRPGYLFAALPGTRTDGRRFIGEALARGAVAVLAPAGTPRPEVPLIESARPRHDLALMAARFYPCQPKTIAAVTGTNGKSSTVDFLRQIWSHAGHEAACLGTLGVTTKDGVRRLHHTTPDPVSLHRELHRLARAGVDHVALEASSHGLEQSRLDGVRISQTGFTNLSQDHFDYHDGFESYFEAKARLFETLAPPGSAAAIMADGSYGKRMAERARARGLEVMEVGWEGSGIRLLEVRPLAQSQHLDLSIDGALHSVELPLAGEFQAQNAVLALALALQGGIALDTALEALGALQGVRGRLQRAGTAASGAPVFVDFAHTRDGLDKLLRAMRPHTKGRIHLVFGCGGDRDPLKRPQMGAVAAQLADRVIVTDDNPRHEDPAKIRKAVLAGCPDALEIADRRDAIATAIAGLEAGDALVIAGKGHESGQIIGDACIPFDDVEIARAVLAQNGGRP